MRFLCRHFARSELFIARRGDQAAAAVLPVPDRESALSILSRGTVEPDVLRWALHQIAWPEVGRMPHHLVLNAVADAILSGRLCLVVRRVAYSGGPPDLQGPGGAAAREEAKDENRRRIALREERKARQAAGQGERTPGEQQSPEAESAAEEGPEKLTAADFPGVGTKVSQKQNRHIRGRKEYRGGSIMESREDAQKVLDAFHSGEAEIIGRHPQGFPVVRVPSVTGTNVNEAAGFPAQRTNVFVIKGTSSPSVFPTNPNWKPKR